ncbi:hypothetical protein BaRGS_00038810 [Batillaria attramentaria]|uniref:AIG1-type G domain-containing protein n=1 Tax=Batillaria attramentaria TaxID=370345 RepID=A0ABD0J5W6_9CAEN
MADSDLPASDPEVFPGGQCRLFLFGSEACGKSSVGNTIMCKEVFEVHHSRYTGKSKRVNFIERDVAEHGCRVELQKDDRFKTMLEEVEGRYVMVNNQAGEPDNPDRIEQSKRLMAEVKKLVDKSEDVFRWPPEELTTRVFFELSTKMGSGWRDFISFLPGWSSRERMLAVIDQAREDEKTVSNQINACLVVWSKECPNYVSLRVILETLEKCNMKDLKMVLQKYSSDFPYLQTDGSEKSKTKNRELASQKTSSDAKADGSGRTRKSEPCSVQ